MKITHDFIETLFSHLTRGQQAEFFKHVADDVQWEMMGTHPLAGIYHTKESFLNHTFRRLAKILQNGLMLQIKHIYIYSDDIVIVELKSISVAINGKPYNNTYCWIMRFVGQKIVEVRSYVDSALVQEVIRNNEK